MTKHGKQIVFAILSALAIGVSECTISNTIQAAQISNKPFLLQAPQPSLITQFMTGPVAQSTKKLDLQPQQVIKWSKDHSSAVLLTAIVLLYLGILWIRPTWLLILPLDKIPKTPISPEIPIPPAIGSFLKYRPRVLDTWVSQRIAQAQETFEERPTVKDRNIHIPIPVELNGNKPAIASLSVSDLRAVFSKQFTRLLIVGEGGVGKTSLACQIAKWAMAENKADRLCRHRMLPVLIEEELESIEGKSPLLEAIAIASIEVKKSLLARIEDENEQPLVKVSAGEALCELGVASEAPILKLLPLLEDDDEFVREYLIDTLGRFGFGRQVETALQHVCHNEKEERLRKFAKQALEGVLNRINS